MKDFSKAFDKLQPSILLSKLEKFGIQHSLIDLIENFLTDRHQKVSMNASSSSVMPITVGAPQGTRLGPWLWLAFVDDLQPASGATVKYADDVTAYVPVRKKVIHDTDLLQSALDYSVQWCEDNSMSINDSKTTVLDVALVSKPELVSVPTINDTDLSKISSTKLLGVVIDSRLTFSDHVDKIVNKCNSLNYFLQSLKRLDVNTTGVQTFYFSKIRSNITYACAAWFPLISGNDKSKIEGIERWSLTIIYPELGSYRQRLAKSNVVPILDFLQVLTDRHFDKVATNPSHPLQHFLVRRQRHKDKSDIFYPPICRTERFKNSFLVSGMNRHL